jgi:hypothetical protein
MSHTGDLRVLLAKLTNLREHDEEEHTTQPHVRKSEGKHTTQPHVPKSEGKPSGKKSHEEQHGEYRPSGQKHPHAHFAPSKKSQEDRRAEKERTQEKKEEQSSKYTQYSNDEYHRGTKNHGYFDPKTGSVRRR